MLTASSSASSLDIPSHVHIQPSHAPRVKVSSSHPRDTPHASSGSLHALRASAAALILKDEKQLNQSLLVTRFMKNQLSAHASSNKVLSSLPPSHSSSINSLSLYSQQQSDDTAPQAIQGDNGHAELECGSSVVGIGIPVSGVQPHEFDPDAYMYLIPDDDSEAKDAQLIHSLLQQHQDNMQNSMTLDVQLKLSTMHYNQYLTKSTDLYTDAKTNDLPLTNSHTSSASARSLKTATSRNKFMSPLLTPLSMEEHKQFSRNGSQAKISYLTISPSASSQSLLSTTTNSSHRRKGYFSHHHRFLDTEIANLSHSNSTNSLLLFTQHSGPISKGKSLIYRTDKDNANVPSNKVLNKLRAINHATPVSYINSDRGIKLASIDSTSYDPNHVPSVVLSSPVKHHVVKQDLGPGSYDTTSKPLTQHKSLSAIDAPINRWDDYIKQQNAIKMSE